MIERALTLATPFPPVRYLRDTDMDPMAFNPLWLWLGFLMALVGMALCVWAYRLLSSLEKSQEGRIFRKPCPESLLVFGAAFFVRLIGLFSEPLTEFEMATVLMIEREDGFPGLGAHLDAAFHGYFPLLLWGAWLPQVLSGSFLGGRVVSAFVGALAVGLAAFVLGKPMHKRERYLFYLALIIFPTGVFLSRWVAGYIWVLLGQVLILVGAMALRKGEERRGWTQIVLGLLLGASSQVNGVFTGAVVLAIWIVRISRGGTAKNAALRALPALFGVVLLGMPWFIPALVRASSLEYAGSFLPYHAVSPEGVLSDLGMMLYWTFDLATVGALPVPGLVPVVAGIWAAGLLRSARVDRESMALVVGFLAVFVLVFLNMALGPYMLGDIDGVYFHMRQHGVLVILGSLSLWGWFYAPRVLTSVIASGMALVALAGWVHLEIKEHQPDYRGAFDEIAEEFEEGDGILVLPSYTNWAVVRHYASQSAGKKGNRDFQAIMNGGYEQPRFMVPIRVPLEDQLRTQLAKRLWVIVVDDRVWGIYPHYNFEYAKRGMIAAQYGYDAVQPWQHRKFVAWRLFRKKAVQEIWGKDGKRIEAGVNDLYYLEEVYPPPLLKRSERKFTFNSKLRISLPPETCSVHVEVGLVAPEKGRDLRMKESDSTGPWLEGDSQTFNLKPGTKWLALDLRPDQRDQELAYRHIHLNSQACPEKAEP